MDTTVSYYVRKKVKDDFDKCNWTDGVGKKFEDVALTEMLKALDELETARKNREVFTNAERYSGRHKTGISGERRMKVVQGNYRQYQLVDKTRKKG